MGGAKELLDIIATWQNALIFGAAWILTQTLSKAWPKVFDSPAAKRLKPLAAMIWCSICMWIPELSPENMGTGSKILLGVIIGNAVAHGHKIIKHTVFGKMFADHPNGKRHDPKTRELVNEFLDELRTQGKIENEVNTEEEKKTVKLLSKYLEKFLT